MLTTPSSVYTTSSTPIFHETVPRKRHLKTYISKKKILVIRSVTSKMNYSRKLATIFISTQILYLLYLPAIICTKNKHNAKDGGTKLANLPLVLLQTGNSEEYSFPRCFRRDSQGKIVDFTAINSQCQQVYFCPDSPTENNLYPTDGKNYRCEEPPQPQIRKTATNGCGKERDSYSYGYKLFETPVDQQNISKTWIEIYSFCYDKENKQVAYLSYRILSPNLLENRQLEREYSYYELDYRLGQIEDESLKAYVASIMEALDRKNISSYFIQMELGHPVDMIFPTWKKPFYHAVNQGLLIPQLKNQWRKIGRHVRELAQKKLGELDIITGTLPYPEDKKLFGIWWKLVIYKNRAIAIILHNIFIERPKKVKKGKGKSKHTRKNKKIRDKTSNNITDNESKINTDVEPQKNYISSDGISSKTSSAIVINTKPIAVETRKNDADLDAEPQKNHTNANDNITTNQTTNDDGESSIQYRMLCKDICREIGFGGLADKNLAVHAYCCHPKVITERLGLQNYEILDLNQILETDASVMNDGCPKDPIQDVKSIPVEVSRDSSSAVKSRT